MSEFVIVLQHGGNDVTYKRCIKVLARGDIRRARSWQRSWNFWRILSQMRFFDLGFFALFRASACSWSHMIRVLVSLEDHRLAKEDRCWWQLAIRRNHSEEIKGCMVKATLLAEPPSVSSSWKHGKRKKGELQSWHYYEARTGLVTWRFRACSIKKVEVVGRGLKSYQREGQPRKTEN